MYIRFMLCVCMECVCTFACTFIKLMYRISSMCMYLGCTQEGYIVAIIVYDAYNTVSK